MQPKKKFVVSASAKLYSSFVVDGESVEEVKRRMEKMGTVNFVTLMLLENKLGWEVDQINVTEVQNGRGTT